MKTKRDRIWTLVLFGAMILFIWGNSLTTSGPSNAMSNFLSGVLKPLLDPNGMISQRTFAALVRKAAHMIEFAVLGGVLMRLTLRYAEQKGRAVRDYLCTPLFITLATAVTDEFIQSFTGRTSSVRDVLIDFVGGVGGMILVGVIWRLTGRRTR